MNLKRKQQCINKNTYHNKGKQAMVSMNTDSYTTSKYQSDI